VPHSNVHALSGCRCRRITVAHSDELGSFLLVGDWGRLAIPPIGRIARPDDWLRSGFFCVVSAMPRFEPSGNVSAGNSTRYCRIVLRAWDDLGHFGTSAPLRIQTPGGEPGFVQAESCRLKPARRRESVRWFPWCIDRVVKYMIAPIRSIPPSGSERGAWRLTGRSEDFSKDLDQDHRERLVRECAVRAWLSRNRRTRARRRTQLRVSHSKMMSVSHPAAHEARIVDSACHKTGNMVKWENENDARTAG
jgi:hypothetical protein